MIVGNFFHFRFGEHISTKIFFGESFAAKPGLGSLAVDILLVSEFKPTLKQKIFDERFVFDFVKLFIRKQCSFALQSF